MTLCTSRYFSVPDGATLEFTVIGTTGFVASAELRKAGTVIEQWTHTELVDKKVRRKLKALANQKHSYLLIVTVAFTTASLADPVLEVEIPDKGKRRCEFSGKTGDLPQDAWVWMHMEAGS